LADDVKHGKLPRTRHATVVTQLALASVLCGCGDAIPTEPVDVVPTPGLHGFAARLDSLRVELRIPGMAAAITQGNAIVWSMGFGYADVARSQSATDTTAFYLASVTKPIGAIIVMQLVEEGLVDLDSPVRQYGVDLENSDVVTVRHLLNHTSEGVPGTVHRYNGERYSYLTDVIRSASGRTFAELLVERILQPLGLRHTAPCIDDLADFYVTGLDRQAFIANLARPYELIDGGIVPSSYPRHFSPAAGLIGSARDVARISISLDQGDLLGAQASALMLSPSISIAEDGRSYGLGWYIQNYQGITLEWHGGEWNAQSALLLRVPERQLTLVAVANTRRMSGAYRMGIGDVMQSGVAQLFMNAFVFGNEPLP
jgi:CubicO group peptidase (beta-lactamase class C family)